MKFTVIKKEGTARRGVFETVHGTVQTPAFMNVATCGAIKGAVSSYDLKDIHCQVQLCNTYHLHLRPGDELVKEFGGLHKFTGRAHTHGQRRIPGLFARKAPQDKRGGSLFFLAYRRTQDFYGSRGEYENTVEPRLDYRHGL